MNSSWPFDGDSRLNRIFGDSKRKTGGRPFLGAYRRKPAPDAAAEAEPPETDPVEPPNYVEKAEPAPKVVLKNPAWSVDKASFNDKVRVLVEAEVPPPLAHLTRIEFKLWALIPDGKREAVGKMEGHLKDGRAAGEVTLFYPQYRDGGNLLSACGYVFSAKHRESDEVESKALPVKQPFASKVRWDKAEEWFGLPVKLLADTCLKDGEEVTVKVASENGVALDAKAKAKKGKLEIPWTPCLCGVSPDAGGKYPEKVEFYAELSHGEERAVPEKNFFLKVVGETEYHTFAKDCVWGEYGAHAEFKQRLKKGSADVQVKKTIMKAWQGFMVDMTRAGLTGIVPGCPFDRQRWGRVKGKGETPNQYHDGSQWLPMPKGFTPRDKEFSAYGFIQSGGHFILGGIPRAYWPDKFLDYDFDKPAYVKKRQDWKQDTDSRWSRKFLLRPHSCRKGSGSGGCGYHLDLALELNRIETWQEHAITICKGHFRSNAGCFSLEEPRIAMAAHEVGHLVGMPDEYVDGGIDPTLNGDGATKGIDSTTLMGQSLDRIKKRHYANFASVADLQVERKIGRKTGFVPADQ